MKRALVAFALIFAFQNVHADELTTDLDRLLERLDARTAQELNTVASDSGSEAKLVKKSKKKKHAKFSKKTRRELAQTKSKKKRKHG